MATRTVRSIEPYVCPNGVLYGTVGEELSQTYTKGAPLVRDSSSKELEVWAGGTDATAIAGIAAQDASGTAATATPYYEAREGNLFEGTLVNGSGTVAYSPATHDGVAYSLVAQGSNWCVDTGDTTTTLAVVIRGASREGASGDVNARVVFRFTGDDAANALQA
jgi:hypothetical protein